jgi:hypothetical protein
VIVGLSAPGVPVLGLSVVGLLALGLSVLGPVVPGLPGPVAGAEAGAGT